MDHKIKFLSKIVVLIVIVIIVLYLVNNVGGIETLGQEMPEEVAVIDNSMYGGDQDIFGVENESNKT